MRTDANWKFVSDGREPSVVTYRSTLATPAGLSVMEYVAVGARFTSA